MHILLDDTPFPFTKHQLVIEAAVQFTGFETCKGLLLRLIKPICGRLLHFFDDVEYLAVASLCVGSELFPALTDRSYGLYTCFLDDFSDPFVGPYRYCARGILKLAKHEVGFNTADLNVVTLLAEKYQDKRQTSLGRLIAGEPLNPR